MDIPDGVLGRSQKKSPALKKKACAQTKTADTYPWSGPLQTLRGQVMHVPSERPQTAKRKRQPVVRGPPFPGWVGVVWGLLVGLSCTITRVEPAAYGCDVSFPEAMRFITALEPELPETSDVKLLLFVMHIAHGKLFRDAHRESWLDKPGMCAVDARNQTALTPGTDIKCKAYYTFLIGVDGTAESESAVAHELATHHDLVILTHAKDPAPGEKGGNQLLTPKVRMMFDHARIHFGWATHYGKVDIDSLPLINVALEHIMHVGTDAATQQQIADNEVHTDWSEQNGGIYYGKTMGGHRWMQQGQFYILSAPLTRCVMDWASAQERAGCNIPCNIHGIEDGYMGCLINTATASNPDCSPPIFIDMHEKKVDVEYRLAPLGTFSVQHASFGSWEAASTSMVSVTEDVLKFVPEFGAKYDCILPASSTEPIFQDEAEHSDEPNWHRMTMSELRAYLKTQIVETANAASHFDPTIKGAGEGCGGDPYSIAHDDGSWCLCRPGTVVWSKEGSEYTGNTNTWTKRFPQFAALVAKWAGVMPMACTFHPNENWKECKYHHSLARDYVCKPPADEQELRTPHTLPSVPPPSPAPPPSSQTVAILPVASKASDVIPGACVDLFAAYKIRERDALEKVKALEETLASLRKVISGSHRQ
jgi:hypothetical protein